MHGLGYPAGIQVQFLAGDAKHLEGQGHGHLDLRPARMHLVHKVFALDPREVEAPGPCKFWELQEHLEVRRWPKGPQQLGHMIHRLDWKVRPGYHYDVPPQRRQLVELPEPQEHRVEHRWPRPRHLHRGCDQADGAVVCTLFALKPFDQVVQLATRLCVDVNHDEVSRLVQHTYEAREVGDSLAVVGDDEESQRLAEKRSGTKSRASPRSGGWKRGCTHALATESLINTP